MSRRRRTGLLAGSSRRRAGLVAGAAAALTLALGGLVPAGADAAKRGQAQRELRVEVTGLMHTDWRYRSANFGVQDASWTEAHGTQTVGWSLRRAWRMRLSVYSRELQRFGVEPAALSPLEMPAVKATVARTMRVTDQDAPPACEGSCGSAPPAVTRRAPGCGRRRADVRIGLELHERALAASAEWDGHLDLMYPDCRPMRDSGSGFEFEVPSLAYYAGGLERLTALGVGRRAKFHKEVELGERCPLARGQRWAGYQECAVTAITTEVTRVR